MRRHAPRTLVQLGAASLLSVALAGCIGASGSPPAGGGSSSSASVASSISIDGVDLATVWSTARKSCELAATRTHLRIPCPTVAPAVEHPRDEWQLCRGYHNALEGPGCPHDSFIIEELFHGPSTFRGIPGSNGPSTLGHLTIFASRGKVAISGHTLVSCPSPKPLDTVQVDDVTGRLYSCKSGFAALNSGHIVLAWQKAGATYAVGSHGHTTTSKKLVIEIANRLNYLSSMV